MQNFAPIHHTPPPPHQTDLWNTFHNRKTFLYLINGWMKCLFMHTCIVGLLLFSLVLCYSCTYLFDIWVSIQFKTTVCQLQSLWSSECNIMINLYIWNFFHWFLRPCHHCHPCVRRWLCLGQWETIGRPRPAASSSRSRNAPLFDYITGSLLDPSRCMVEWGVAGGRCLSGTPWHLPLR